MHEGQEVCRNQKSRKSSKAAARGRLLPNRRPHRRGPALCEAAGGARADRKALARGRKRTTFCPRPPMGGQRPAAILKTAGSKEVMNALSNGDIPCDDHLCVGDLGRSGRALRLLVGRRLRWHDRCRPALLHIPDTPSAALRSSDALGRLDPVLSRWALSDRAQRQLHRVRRSVGSSATGTCSTTSEYRDVFDFQGSCSDWMQTGAPLTGPTPIYCGHSLIYNEFTSGSQSCDACAAANCSNEYAACCPSSSYAACSPQSTVPNDCDDLVRCLRACTAGDDAAASACTGLYPDGVAPANAFATCIAQSCRDSCD